MGAHYMDQGALSQLSNLNMFDLIGGCLKTNDYHLSHHKSVVITLNYKIISADNFNDNGGEGGIRTLDTVSHIYP